jgi:hypothetical protein
VRVRVRMGNGDGNGKGNSKGNRNGNGKDTVNDADYGYVSYICAYGYGCSDCYMFMVVVHDMSCHARQRVKAYCTTRAVRPFHARATRTKHTIDRVNTPI